MITGPETGRIISELSVKQSKFGHHEQTPSIQNRFARNVRSVIEAFNEMGNPFTETSTDLFAIDTKVIMADQVVQSIKEAEGLRKQYEAFVDERIVKMTRNIHDAIPKNKLALFTSGQRKTTSKSKAKLSSMKSDLELFSRMYISWQAREGEMNAFFCA